MRQQVAQSLCSIKAQTADKCGGGGQAPAASVLQKLYTRLFVRSCRRGVRMTDTVIKLRLNQQQLELMDRTIARGVAPNRVALIRLAIHEYAAARKAETKAK